MGKLFTRALIFSSTTCTYMNLIICTIFFAVNVSGTCLLSHEKFMPATVCSSHMVVCATAVRGVKYSLISAGLQQVFALCFRYFCFHVCLFCLLICCCFFISSRLQQKTYTNFHAIGFNVWHDVAHIYLTLCRYSLFKFINIYLCDIICFYCIFSSFSLHFSHLLAPQRTDL